ncbi:MAG: NAD(P)-dependent alcohol dehydrogenase [Chloroflexota bacterium]
MKSLMYEQYGNADVLRFKDVAQPPVDKDKVLIRVKAASINKGDWYLLNGRPYLVRLSPGGLRRPRNPILGGDIAGVVTAVGSQVTDFQVGDELYGDISDSGMGGYAEYVAAPAHVLAHKPRNLTFGEAASIPSAAATALQGIRAAGGITPAQSVLIVGASGGVGSFTLQLAKMYGGEVTAVVSNGKIEMARRLGAAHVIDYTRESFLQHGKQYDLILAVNGNHALRDYQRVLTPSGTCVVIGGGMPQIFKAMLLGPLLSRKRGQQIVAMGPTKINQADLQLLAELLEQEKIHPLVERFYPFSEAITAIRDFGKGRTTGKVVITMDEASQTVSSRAANAASA